MDWISHFIHIILHLNVYLGAWFSAYGAWAFGLLFLIVFCETGLVITPFLPGDSLLFAAGSVLATTNIAPYWLALTLISAAFCGDNTNYWFGYWLGPRVFKAHNRWFKQEYLMVAHGFYEKYGLKAIIIGRFLPIFRTFVPFIAGVARMPYRRYISVSLVSALLWVGIILHLGYFFGSIPWVKRNFAVVILAIIIISVLPAIIEAYKRWRARSQRPGA